MLSLNNDLLNHYIGLKTNHKLSYHSLNSMHHHKVTHLRPYSTNITCTLCLFYFSYCVCFLFSILLSIFKYLIANNGVQSKVQS